MTSVNRYSGRCACCGKTVAAGAGIYAWGAVLCSIVEDGDRHTCEVEFAYRQRQQAKTAQNDAGRQSEIH